MNEVFALKGIYLCADVRRTKEKDFTIILVFILNIYHLVYRENTSENYGEIFVGRFLDAGNVDLSTFLGFYHKICVCIPLYIWNT